MKIHKNDRNVWLKGNQMEGYFPGLVKKFTSKKPTGSDNETILNPVGDELVKGYVSIYSTAGDVAKIIQRASKAIVKMYMFIDTENEVTAVDFLVNKDAFRGVVYCFNKNFEPDTPYDTGRSRPDLKGKVPKHIKRKNSRGSIKNDKDQT